MSLRERVCGGWSEYISIASAKELDCKVRVWAVKHVSLCLVVHTTSHQSPCLLHQSTSFQHSWKDPATDITHATLLFKCPRVPLTPSNDRRIGLYDPLEHYSWSMNTPPAPIIVSENLTILTKTMIYFLDYSPDQNSVCWGSQLGFSFSNAQAIFGTALATQCAKLYLYD